MGKYKILINYQSGNSFRCDVYEDYLELEWDNLEVAKRNLAFIKEHWEMYSELNSYRMGKPTKEETFENYSNKQWFVDNGDPHYSEYCMLLEADNGNKMQQRNFWCGYFEDLHGAEIITDNSDMKFTV